MSVLDGKKIVLGITGGIAAYKSAVLLRHLVKEGAEVQVIMTPSAKEFITPLTLSTLSRNPVISEFFTANTGEWHSHVDLGLWADCMVIAPATACTIAKMANGVADNMLVTSYLSARSKVFIAPAMDYDMMRHSSTTNNLAKLLSYGNIIIEPDDGELASGLVGKGRMAEPEVIVERLKTWFGQSQKLKGKKVLITAGPTYERIDPVRFIGNYSSGKMGYAIAEAAADMGAEVVLVSGPVEIACHNKGINLRKVETALEMLEECKATFENCDIAIMAAAVSDYRPESYSDSKIKRQNVDEMSVKLIKNPDIAAELGSSKKESQKLIGFALETDNERENALLKMQKKNLDFIILNSLNDKGAGFGTDTNKVTIFSVKGNECSLPLMPKKELAYQILNTIS